jgi:hypothetical protein
MGNVVEPPRNISLTKDYFILGVFVQNDHNRVYQMIPRNTPIYHNIKKESFTQAETKQNIIQTLSRANNNEVFVVYGKGENNITPLVRQGGTLNVLRLTQLMLRAEKEKYQIIRVNHLLNSRDLEIIKYNKF